MISICMMKVKINMIRIPWAPIQERRWTSIAMLKPVSEIKPENVWHSIVKISQTSTHSWGSAQQTDWSGVCGIVLHTDVHHVSHLDIYVLDHSAGVSAGRDIAVGALAPGRSTRPWHGVCTALRWSISQDRSAHHISRCGTTGYTHQGLGDHQRGCCTLLPYQESTWRRAASNGPRKLLRALGHDNSQEYHGGLHAHRAGQLQKGPVQGN